MTGNRIPIFAFISGLLIFSFVNSSCSRTEIYIVRHAEKDTIPKDNPRLTTDGLRRAEELATLLKDKHISAVYSTNTLRTISTAHPTAEEFHLPLLIYDSIPQLIESIPIRNHESILIVGHSNTILEIAEAFDTRPAMSSINDDDFDNILIISRRRNIFGMSTHLVESTYGSPSP